MEADQSLSKMVKKLEGQVRQILRKLNMHELSIKEKKFVSDLQQNLDDTRIYIADYESSEDQQERLANARLAKKWLVSAQKNILSASEYNIFGAIDVAHLGAQIDQIIEALN